MLTNGIQGVFRKPIACFENILLNLFRKCCASEDGVRFPLPSAGNSIRTSLMR